jgi:hypothetical protein
LQLPDELSYDKYIIGFGHFNSTEWYFVFSDGERSECKTNHRLLDFSEDFIQDDSVVTKIRVVYDQDTGLFKGARFY